MAVPRPAQPRCFHHGRKWAGVLWGHSAEDKARKGTDQWEGKVPCFVVAGLGAQIRKKVRTELRQVGEAQYPLLGSILWKQLYPLPFFLREA